MISKTLVEAYGGDLNVFSPGKYQGSTFFFTMRVAHDLLGPSRYMNSEGMSSMYSDDSDDPISS